MRTHPQLVVRAACCRAPRSMSTACGRSPRCRARRAHRPGGRHHAAPLTGLVTVLQARSRALPGAAADRREQDRGRRGLTAAGPPHHPNDPFQRRGELTWQTRPQQRRAHRADQEDERPRPGRPGPCPRGRVRRQRGAPVAVAAPAAAPRPRPKKRRRASTSSAGLRREEDRGHQGRPPLTGSASKRPRRSSKRPQDRQGRRQQRRAEEAKKQLEAAGATVDVK